MTHISAQQTVDFIKEYIGEKNTKILEVHCGTDSVAPALIESGFNTTTTTDILNFSSEEKFDAVLFYRSLCKTRPLETAFHKVKSLLGEKGRILVEDFAFEQADSKTVNWYYELQDLVSTVAGLAPHAYEAGEGPVERWRKEHEQTPALHAGKDMFREIERFFGTSHSSYVPYLYRYFENCLASTPNPSVALQKIFDWERNSIEKGGIQAVGLRIIAKKYFSYLK